MPTFIALFNWTDQGIRDVKHTAVRATQFHTAIQQAGGVVKDIYWTMGRYDGVIVFEAPDHTTAAAILMQGGARGNIRSETLPAFTQAEVQDVLAKV